MKKTHRFPRLIAVIACAIVLSLAACAALSQENTEASISQSETIVEQFNREVGKWKRNVASPSYGVMLFHGRVRPVQDSTFASSITSEGILLQGIDMRFFIGKNVSTKSGFYSGIESGIFTYFAAFPDASSFTDTVTVTDGPIPYTWPSSFEARVKVDGAFAFLMGKYGFRVDTGSPLYGLSVGLEIGVGGGIRSGGVELFVGDRQNPTAEADFSGVSELSVLADTALGASLRLGRNFRLFAKLGLIILPLKLNAGDPMEVNQSVMTDSLTNSAEEYMRYALQHYVVEMDTFAYELRVGFALSFN